MTRVEAGSAGRLSRRDFIVGAAAAATALGLAGCTTEDGAAEGLLPEKWDQEADVVIVGAGAAGISAALAVNETGAKALVLEKQPVIGGDTVLSAQMLAVGRTPEKLAEEWGIPYQTTDEWLASLKEVAWPQSKMFARGDKQPTDLQFPSRYADLGNEAWDALIGYGIKVVGVPGFAIAGPPGLIPQLQPVLETQNIEVLTSTAATMLYTSSDGRVIGVRAYRGNERINVKANKGVILACSSPCGNRGIISEFLPALGSATAGGAPGNTGDGHLMAREVGAAWRNMDLGVHWYLFEFPTNSGNFLFGQGLGVYVGAFFNMSGKRFVNETLMYSRIGDEIWAQEGKTAFYVFDSTAAEGYFETNGLLNPAYSPGKSLPIVEDTLTALANSMQVDPVTFEAEVAKYNGYVTAQNDADFGRTFSPGVNPIAVPPFYAVRQVPKHYFMYGGVAVDVDSHVVNAEGNVIPGLYAAGGVCGDFNEQAGFIYGGGVFQGWAWGRQAGKNAAAESV